MADEDLLGEELQFVVVAWLRQVFPAHHSSSQHLLQPITTGRSVLFSRMSVRRPGGGPLIRVVFPNYTWKIVKIDPGADTVGDFLAQVLSQLQISAKCRPFFGLTYFANGDGRFVL